MTPVRRNLTGTVNPSFTIGGPTGPTILQGSGVPDPALGQDGNLYLQRSPAAVHMKLNGVWTAVVNAGTASRATVYRGSTYNVATQDTIISVLRSPYTIDTTEFTIDTTTMTIDMSIAATTAVILPASPEGRAIVIKDETSSASTYTIRVSDGTGETIDGETFSTIANDHGYMELLYSGGKWNIVGR